jgi:hypothetical protein
MTCVLMQIALATQPRAAQEPGRWPSCCPRNACLVCHPEWVKALVRVVGVPAHLRRIFPGGVFVAGRCRSGQVRKQTAAYDAVMLEPPPGPLHSVRAPGWRLVRPTAPYDQMYFSAMAPSRHFATVTILPPALELADHARPISGAKRDRVSDYLGRRAAGRLDIRLHGIDVRLNPPFRFLALPVDVHVVGVVTGEHAMPISVVPSREVEVIDALEVGGRLIL